MAYRLIVVLLCLVGCSNAHPDVPLFIEEDMRDNLVSSFSDVNMVESPDESIRIITSGDWGFYSIYISTKGSDCIVRYLKKLKLRDGGFASISRRVVLAGGFYEDVVKYLNVTPFEDLMQGIKSGEIAGLPGDDLPYVYVEYLLNRNADSHALYFKPRYYEDLREYLASIQKKVDEHIAIKRDLF